MNAFKEQARFAKAKAESRPFLDDAERPSETDETVDESSRTQSARFRARLCSSKFAIAHTIAFLFYTLIFLFYLFTTNNTECEDGPSRYCEFGKTPSPDMPVANFYAAPARDAVSYELRPVDGLADESIYAGYPTPESDEAWSSLVEGINIKVYPDEMSRLGDTSLKMRDGSGYLAVLGVYHELHCIKRLRKWFYQDYYYPNQTVIEYNERMTHAEHCLEFIRQSAICHGDTTVTSFKWLHDSHGDVIEPTTKEGALHRCVNWDQISEWTKSRRVDLFDRNLLVPEGEE